MTDETTTIQQPEEPGPRRLLRSNRDRMLAGVAGGLGSYFNVDPVIFRIGFVVATQCNYSAPIAFPQTVEAGIRVAQAGRSSVRYEIALFAEGADSAAAQGHFIHVYVDRVTQRPVPLPEALQRVVDSLKA